MMNVPSILSDVRVQTSQQSPRQTSLFIQQGIDLPRIVPEKRQKKNRNKGNFTPLKVMILVPLQPQRVLQQSGHKTLCYQEHHGHIQHPGNNQPEQGL